MISPKIDILCYYDNHHSILYDLFFYPTYKKYLSDDFNLISHVQNSKYDTTGFESKNWSEILIKRFDILKDYINSHKNTWAIFSDIDIIFLNNFIDDIKPLMNNNIDIYYMSEVPNGKKFMINGGFFLFRCNNYIYDFFDHIQKEVSMMEIPNDQTYITNFLKNNKFNSSLLSNYFLANNVSPKLTIRSIKNKQAKVLHATSSASVIDKCQILSSALCLSDYNNHKYRSNLWI